MSGHSPFIILLKKAPLVLLLGGLTFYYFLKCTYTSVSAVPRQVARI